MYGTARPAAAPAAVLRNARRVERSGSIRILLCVRRTPTTATFVRVQAVELTCMVRMAFVRCQSRCAVCIHDGTTAVDNLTLRGSMRDGSWQGDSVGPAVQPRVGAVLQCGGRSLHWVPGRLARWIARPAVDLGGARGRPTRCHHHARGSGENVLAAVCRSRAVDHPVDCRPAR